MSRADPVTDEAVDRAAAAVHSAHGDDDGWWPTKRVVRVALDAAAPLLEAQVRQACAEELRTALDPSAASTEVRTWPTLQRLIAEWSASGELADPAEQ